jgi:hypothetical protein
MSETSTKGELGEVMVMADLVKRGYKIAIPLGEDWRFDLILFRDNKLEKVQVKCTESDGEVIRVRTQYNVGGNGSDNHGVKYTPNDTDWIACYDVTTDKCYYIPSSDLGQYSIALRLKEAKNKQKKNVRWAKDYKALA